MTVRKLVDYKLVDIQERENGPSVADRIKSHADDGYELVGNPHRNKSGHLQQAMAKYVDYHEDLKKRKRFGLF